MRLTRATAVLAWLCVPGLCGGLVACGDEAPQGAASPEADADQDADAGADDADDLGLEPEPDVAPDVADEPDLKEPEDAAEEPDVLEEPDVADEPDLPVEPPDAGTACQAEAACIKEHYDCLGGVCTLNPTGRAFVETNYVLEQPSALTNVVSVAKGLFSDTGFFLTEVAGLEGDAARVYYGGGDRLEQHDDGPDVYRWQLPNDLPSFLMRRLQDPERPLQGNTWRSDVFDYELVALFGDEVPRGRLGFEAVQTQVTMTFDPDLTQIMEGRIEGYITRAEAERRELGLVDNCALSRLLCPAYDCTNDPPLATFAELLDCNGVPTDADLDPLIEGNDAYRASIFFQSERVELVE